MTPEQHIERALRLALTVAQWVFWFALTLVALVLADPATRATVLGS